jgi:hypothetical protein
MIAEIVGGIVLAWLDGTDFPYFPKNPIAANTAAAITARMAVLITRANVLTPAIGPLESGVGFGAGIFRFPSSFP